MGDIGKNYTPELIQHWRKLKKFAGKLLKLSKFKLSVFRQIEIQILDFTRRRSKIENWRFQPS